MEKFKLATASQKKKYAKLLSPDEDVLVVTRISNLYFWSQLIRLIPTALLIFGIPALIRLIRKKQSFCYVLTNKRCLIIQGIFSRKLITAPLAAITHVTVEQSWTERFFYHCGQIVVITAGYDPREIVIEYVPHPVEFKILMEQLAGKLEENRPQVEKPVVTQTQFRHLKLG